MAMFSLQNYVDKNGKEPIKIWLQSLASVERKRILMRSGGLKTATSATSNK